MTAYSKRSEKRIAGILSSAIKLFQEYGYDKVSVDEIAELANTSKVTIYKYFTSKENLYIKVVEKLLHDYEKDCEQIVKSDISFESKLTSFIRLQLNYYKFNTKVLLNNFDASQFPEEMSRLYNLNNLFHQQARQEGLIPPNITDDAINNYFDILMYGMLHKYKESGYVITEQEIESITKLVYYGILQQRKND